MKKKYLIDQLQKAGYKLTPQRRAIVNALLDYEGTPSAADLHKRLEAEYPDLSLDTIYRTLNILVKLGLLIQMDLRSGKKSRFKLGNQPHHHHLICLSCGQAVCLDYCPLSGARQATDCEIVSHTFELYGYCTKCAEESK
jgi:Fe2+ or Zn2+ uptake regulation protein